MVRLVMIAVTDIVLLIAPECAKLGSLATMHHEPSSVSRPARVADAGGFSMRHR